MHSNNLLERYEETKFYTINRVSYNLSKTEEQKISVSDQRDMTFVAIQRKWQKAEYDLYIESASNASASSKECKHNWITNTFGLTKFASKAK